MPFNRIVLLAGEWDTTPIVYNFLQESLPVQKVIIEQPVPRIKFLKNRIRKLGWIEVAGQVLFQLLISKPLARASKKRITEILQAYRLSTKPIPSNTIVCVSSVNDNESLLQLQQLKPDLVIVHGTRIISNKILQAVDAPFINIHAGITPRYRGSHGAYWALANNDAQHCGVTVHLVDPGIDTGNILAQTLIPYTKKDNFITYPYLQLAEGLLSSIKVIHELSNERLPRLMSKLDSKLWYHPTLWSYLYTFLIKGIK